MSSENEAVQPSPPKLRIVFVDASAALRSKVVSTRFRVFQPMLKAGERNGISQPYYNCVPGPFLTCGGGAPSNRYDAEGCRKLLATLPGLGRYQFRCSVAVLRCSAAV